MKKLIIAGALIAGAALAPLGVANADDTDTVMFPGGHPGCSNPCALDGDATIGDLTKGGGVSAPSVYHAQGAPPVPKPKQPALFGPVNSSSGSMDDNAMQDMPLYSNDQGSY